MRCAFFSDKALMHHCAYKMDWPTFKLVILAKFLTGANN
jgi:hypothetical protein